MPDLSPQLLAERMKKEILEDIARGVLPETVASFSELHEFVDANCYGGTETLLRAISARYPDTDEGQTAAMQEFCSLANPAMEIVSHWLACSRDNKLTGVSE
jgi:hypothetical protein